MGALTFPVAGPHRGPAVDIRRFGLKTVDEASAFDNATRWESAVDSGEVLYIPKGIIQGSTFAGRAGLVAVGAGWDSVLKLVDGSDLSVLTFDSADDWYLGNFAIDGNKANQTLGQNSRGVYITTTGARWRAERLKIFDVQDHGLFTSNIDCGVDAVVSGCLAQDCGSAEHLGAGGAGGTGIAVSGTRAQLTDNLAFGNHLNGFKGIGGTYKGCVSRNNGNGFETGSATPENPYTTYLACIADGNTLDGFRHQGQGDFVSVINSRAVGNGGCGVTILNGVAKAQILGNVIRANGLSATRSNSQGVDGVWVGASGATPPDNVIIDGNIITDHDDHASESQYGIYVDDGVGDVKIGRNNVVSGNKTAACQITSGANISLEGFVGHEAEYADYTDTAVGGSAATFDMKSRTIPARSLVPGSVIEYEGHGTVTGTNNTKVIRTVIAGTTNVASSQAAGDQQNWYTRGTVTICPGGLAYHVNFNLENGAQSGVAHQQISYSLSSALVIGMNATLGGTDTVTQKMWRLRLR